MLATNMSDRGIWHGGKLVPPGATVELQALPKRVRGRIAKLARELDEINDKDEDAKPRRAEISKQIDALKKSAKPSSSVRSGLFKEGKHRRERPQSLKDLTAAQARTWIEIEDSAEQLKRWAASENRADIAQLLSEKLAKAS